jgi:hypothetical protein
MMQSHCCMCFCPHLRWCPTSRQKLIGSISCKQVRELSPKNLRFLSFRIFFYSFEKMRCLSRHCLNSPYYPIQASGKCSRCVPDFEFFFCKKREQSTALPNLTLTILKSCSWWCLESRGVHYIPLKDPAWAITWYLVGRVLPVLR